MEEGFLGGAPTADRGTLRNAHFLLSSADDRLS